MRERLNATVPLMLPLRAICYSISTFKMLISGFDLNRLIGNIKAFRESALFALVYGFEF